MLFCLDTNSIAATPSAVAGCGNADEPALSGPQPAVDLEIVGDISDDDTASSDDDSDGSSSSGEDDNVPSLHSEPVLHSSMTTVALSIDSFGFLTEAGRVDQALLKQCRSVLKSYLDDVANLRLSSFRFLGYIIEIVRRRGWLTIGDDGLVKTVGPLFPKLALLCHHAVARFRKAFSQSAEYSIQLMLSAALMFDEDVRAGAAASTDEIAGLVQTASLDFEKLDDPIQQVGDDLEKCFLQQLKTTAATALSYCRRNPQMFGVSRACMDLVLAATASSRETVMRDSGDPQVSVVGDLTVQQRHLLRFLACRDRGVAKKAPPGYKLDVDYKNRHLLALRVLMSEQRGRLRREVRVVPEASSGVYHAVVSAQVMGVLRSRLVKAVGADSPQARAGIDMTMKPTAFSIMNTSPGSKLWKLLERYHVDPSTGTGLCKWPMTNGDAVHFTLKHVSTVVTVHDSKCTAGCGHEDVTMSVEGGAKCGPVASPTASANGRRVSRGVGGEDGEGGELEGDEDDEEKGDEEGEREEEEEESEETPLNTTVLNSVSKSMGALNGKIIPHVSYDSGMENAGVFTIEAAAQAVRALGERAVDLYGADPGRCSELLIWCAFADIVYVAHALLFTCVAVSGRLHHVRHVTPVCACFGL